jgi:hypothetical protein
MVTILFAVTVDLDFPLTQPRHVRAQACRAAQARHRDQPSHGRAVDAVAAQSPLPDLAPTWRSLLRNHFPDIAAIDMFVVATVTLLEANLPLEGHEAQIAE